MLYFPLSSYKQFKEIPVKQEFYYAKAWYKKIDVKFVDTMNVNCIRLSEFGGDELPSYISGSTWVIEKHNLTII